ncbi:hypothetical protein F5Y06DRAFT_274157 [Hypoxylon sp. FL0890]|nr:hypothetical protein F5Y06DRAFT_274157 [Hypoxylon sp. FL0890]
MAENISITGWYAILSGSILALLMLLRLFRFCHVHFRTWLHRHLIYPILISKVTRLQAGLLLIYVSINAMVLVLFLKNTVELKQRAALVSILNMVPLFLGGRTSPLADLGNISLHTYYYWHVWVGRVAAIQSLLHAGLSLYQPTSKRDSITISGWIIAILLMIILLLSLPFIRKRLFVLYIKLHFLLVLSALVSLIWHVLTQPLSNKAAVFTAAGLWISSIFYRVLLYLRWGRNARVEESWIVNHATYMKVRFRTAIRPRPGMYFYLYFSGLPLRYKFQGFPIMGFFWRIVPGEAVTDEIHFLVQHRDSLANAATGAALRNVHLEGPYGKNYRLETYETVLLIAEGIGITGVLPYALHLAQRRHHDERFKATHTELYRDVTRKVDVLWKLECNEEEEWCHEQLTELMYLDTKKTLVSGRLFYPTNGPAKLRIPNNSAKFWKRYAGYSDKMVDENIDHYIKWNSYSPGKSVVLVCGSPHFSQRIREFIVKAPQLRVDFIEPEFTPKTRPRPSSDSVMKSRGAGQTLADLRDMPLSLLQSPHRSQNHRNVIRTTRMTQETRS